MHPGGTLRALHPQFRFFVIIFSETTHHTTFQVCRVFILSFHVRVNIRCLLVFYLCSFSSFSSISSSSYSSTSICSPSGSSCLCSNDGSWIHSILYSSPSFFSSCFNLLRKLSISWGQATSASRANCYSDCPKSFSSRCFSMHL